MKNTSALSIIPINIRLINPIFNKAPHRFAKFGNTFRSTLFTLKFKKRHLQIKTSSFSIHLPNFKEKSDRRLTPWHLRKTKESLTYRAVTLGGHKARDTHSAAVRRLLNSVDGRSEQRRRDGGGSQSCIGRKVAWSGFGG